jgi:hypothetical protein
MFKDGTKSIGSATLDGGVATLLDSKRVVDPCNHGDL